MEDMALIILIFSRISKTHNQVPLKKNEKRVYVLDAMTLGLNKPSV